MRNGNGTNFFSTGERYIGEWKDNKRHGKGKNFYNDVTIFEGEWEFDIKKK